MASESKRQSTTTNKVPIALPKVDSNQQGNAHLISQDASLQMTVGSRIRVNTSQSTQSAIEGTIYVADPITNLLVLNTSATSQTTTITSASHAAPAGSYKFIPISQITSFQLLSLPQATNDIKPGTPTGPSSAAVNTLDTNALNTRLNRNIAAAQSAQTRQGPKGTSVVDQSIFDALSRTQPTRWQGTSMVVSDLFIIEKPYNQVNVKVLPGMSGDLDRMKRVLDMERNKVKLKLGLNITDGRGSGGDNNAATNTSGAGGSGTAAAAAAAVTTTGSGGKGGINAGVPKKGG